MPLKDDDPPERPTRCITEAEYDVWYSPLSAVRLLRLIDVTLAHAVILERVRSGRIVAVAEHVVIRHSYREEEAHYWIIPKGFWRDQGRSPRLWAVGDIEFDVSGATSYATSTRYICSGVRFEPAAVRKLLPQETPDLIGRDSLVGTISQEEADQATAAWEAREAARLAREEPRSDQEPTPRAPQRPAPSKPNQKPWVSDARLTTWFRAFDAQNPDAVHHAAKAAAERKFPNSRIGKNQLYRVMKDVRGTIKRGNPAMSRPRTGH